jgi:anti-anti-sigma factor
VSTSGDFDVQVATMPGDAVVVEVSGELDLATAPRLEAAITEAGRASRLVVDLSECTFLDSAGVRALASAVHEKTQRPVALVVTDPGIMRVIEITRLDTLLEVHSTREAAL